MLLVNIGVSCLLARQLRLFEISSAFQVLLELPNLTVVVAFAVKPEFIGHSKAAAAQGQQITLNCEVWSYPSVSSMVILRDQTEIKSDAHVSVSELDVIAKDTGHYQQKLALTFRSVRAADYRSYTCKASNPIGRVTQQLVLQEPSKNRGRCL